MNILYSRRIAALNTGKYLRLLAIVLLLINRNPIAFDFTCVTIGMYNILNSNVYY